MKVDPNNNPYNDLRNMALGASITEATPLPDKNGLTFYFLTNKGKYKASEQMQNIENEKSQWLDLFEEANKLITELRNVSER